MLVDLDIIMNGIDDRGMRNTSVMDMAYNFWAVACSQVIDWKNC